MTRFDIACVACGWMLGVAQGTTHETTARIARAFERYDCPRCGGRRYAPKARARKDNKRRVGG
jgi:predicted RNA-binding Zn-ribbon protein involved in translation (DUF1610 family)